MEDGLANWQWLAHLPSRSDALLLVRRADSPDWHLTEGFASIRRVVVSESWNDDVPTHSMDCVAVPDASALRGGLAPMDAIVAAAHRVLRPGTGVYVGVEAFHEGPARSFTGVRRAKRHAQARSLEKAGFRDIREYYVVQSPEAPRHLIPGDAAALKAWERAISGRGWRSRVRSAIYSLGAEAILLRHRIVIAHA